MLKLFLIKKDSNKYTHNTFQLLRHRSCLKSKKEQTRSKILLTSLKSVWLTIDFPFDLKFALMRKKFQFC